LAAKAVWQALAFPVVKKHFLGGYDYGSCINEAAS
jgi:hypothetical protein